MYPYEILHLPISHTPAIVIFCLTFNSFNRFLLHIFVILEATLKFFMFFTLFFKLLSLSFSLTSHSYLPHPSSIFSLNSVNFIIYFLLRAVVISDGFTFVSSKIFILRPITPLVCVASFTLGSHYTGSSSSSFVCATPLNRLSSPRSRSFRRIYFALLLRPAPSFFTRALLTVLVVPALPPFALSYLSSSHPP